MSTSSVDSKTGTTRPGEPTGYQYVIGVFFGKESRPVIQETGFASFTQAANRAANRDPFNIDGNHYFVATMPVYDLPEVEPLTDEELAYPGRLSTVSKNYDPYNTHPNTLLGYEYLTPTFSEGQDHPNTHYQGYQSPAQARDRVVPMAGPTRHYLLARRPVFSQPEIEPTIPTGRWRKPRPLAG